jgi:hypothetical protein
VAVHSSRSGIGIGWRYWGSESSPNGSRQWTWLLGATFRFRDRVEVFVCGCNKNLISTTNVNKDLNFSHQDKLYTKMCEKTVQFRICNWFVDTSSDCGAIYDLLVCIPILTRILGQICLYMNWDGVRTC